MLKEIQKFNLIFFWIRQASIFVKAALEKNYNDCWIKLTFLSQKFFLRNRDVENFSSL